LAWRISRPGGTIAGVEPKQPGPDSPPPVSPASPLAAPLLDRRSLLVGLGAGALALGTVGPGTPFGLGAGDALAAKGGGGTSRRALRRRNRVRESLRYRTRMAKMAARRPLVDNVSNGDEDTVEHFAGSYSKGLPHDARGHVDPAAYAALVAAAESGRSEDFDAIPLGLGRKLTSAQASVAFDLQGCDSHHSYMPPAPAFSYPQAAAEMVELYWMALLRDVPFDQFGTHPLAKAAADELNLLPDYRGAKIAEAVTTGSLFRGLEPGCEVGPYVSQFLWQDIPYGAQVISQRSQTSVPGSDWLTDYDSWLAVQNGADPRGTDVLDPTRRYLRDFRGLGRWVQIDALYQGYLNACLILLGLRAPFKAGIPSTVSRNCEGFVDWGPPHLMALVCEVSTRALKAVWYHKWQVHRRLRPEAFGGRVHNHLTGVAGYPINPDVLGSEAVQRIFDEHGTYLLPLAFPEGSPTHPSYGSGHATVAGACTTILKAWFDESWELPNPVVPTPDGTALVPYVGPPLTVGGELNKVAANVAIGRNGAGVHWLSDYYESVRLGERVALTILEEQKPSYNQSPTFELTSFDGEHVVV